MSRRNRRPQVPKVKVAVREQHLPDWVVAIVALLTGAYYAVVLR